MATLRISIMSIIAMVVMIMCILAISLFEYEAPSTSSAKTRSSLGQTYEALLAIVIILGVIVVIITCANNPNLTGKTYLIFALSSILLLAAAICFGVDGVKKNQGADIASMVFTVLGILVSIFGVIAPFLWNRAQS